MATTVYERENCIGAGESYLKNPGLQIPVKLAVGTFSIVVIPILLERPLLISFTIVF